MSTLRMKGTNIPVVKVLLMDYTREMVYVIKNDQGNHYHDEAPFDMLCDQDISMPHNNVLAKYRSNAKHIINPEGELER